MACYAQCFPWPMSSNQAYAPNLDEWTVAVKATCQPRIIHPHLHALQPAKSIDPFPWVSFSHLELMSSKILPLVGCPWSFSPGKNRITLRSYSGNSYKNNSTSSLVAPNLHRSHLSTLIFTGSDERNLRYTWLTLLGSLSESSGKSHSRLNPGYINQLSILIPILS